jgi:hypothetical protein
MDGGLTCLSALAFSEADLQRSDEVIRSIRAPDDRMLTMRDLVISADNLQDGEGLFVAVADSCGRL